MENQAGSAQNESPTVPRAAQAAVAVLAGEAATMVVHRLLGRKPWSEVWAAGRKRILTGLVISQLLHGVRLYVEHRKREGARRDTSR